MGYRRAVRFVLWLTIAPAMAVQAGNTLCGSPLSAAWEPSEFVSPWAQEAVKPEEPGVQASGSQKAREDSPGETTRVQAVSETGSSASPVPYSQRVSRELARVAADASPALVNISARLRVGAAGRSVQAKETPVVSFLGQGVAEAAYGYSPERGRRVLGTGFLVDPSGLVLTSRQVVSTLDPRSEQLEVRILSGEAYGAQIAGVDEELDIAFLKVAGDREFPSFDLGEATSPQPGDWVIALGDPFGAGYTMNIGIKSGEAQTSGLRIERFIQTSLSIDPTNRGGPVIDGRGRLAGLAAGYRELEGSPAAGLVVSAGVIQQQNPEFFSGTEIRRGWLGIRTNPFPLTPALAAFLGVAGTDPEGIRDGDGAVVTALIDQDGNLSDQGPAAKAGLREGDVIVKVDDELVRSDGDLSSLIRNAPPDRSMQFTVVRRGEVLTFEVALAERREAPPELLELPEKAPELDRNASRGIGLEVRTFRMRESREQGFGGERGVFVISVKEGGLAEEAGIEVGQVITHVNGSQIGSARELVELLGNMPSGSPVVFRLVDTNAAGQKGAGYTSQIKP